MSPRQISRSEDHGQPVEARRMIGARLRAVRENTGTSRTSAAGWIGKDPTTLSRIEGGNNPIKDTDLDTLLTCYGVNGQEKVALLALNTRINEATWWTPYRRYLPSWYCSYLMLEAAARYVFTYENRFIPGLLQTPEYAESVIRARFTDDDHVRRLVDIRRHRQNAILNHPSGEKPAAQLWAIIDGAALQDGPGGPAIMRRQIAFLEHLDARYPHLTIQVVTRGAHAARSNSFSILRLHPVMLPEVVYLEHLNDALFLDHPTDSDPYRHAWSEIGLAVDKHQKPADLLQQARQRLS